MTVSTKIDLDLGNNSLTDEGLKFILDSLKNFKYLKEISLDLESVPGKSKENSFT